jgi:hypothetical protein
VHSRRGIQQRAYDLATEALVDHQKPGNVRPRSCTPIPIDTTRTSRTQLSPRTSALGLYERKGSCPPPPERALPRLLRPEKSTGKPTAARKSTARPASKKASGKTTRTTSKATTRRVSSTGSGSDARTASGGASLAEGRRALDAAAATEAKLRRKLKEHRKAVDAVHADPEGPRPRAERDEGAPQDREEVPQTSRSRDVI